jgi:hypothetical protein
LLVELLGAQGLLDCGLAMVVVLQAMLRQKELLFQNHHHRQSTIEQALSPEQLNQQEEMIRRLKQTN